MKIKRFVDKDSRGAMAQARTALGPEAVILSNKRVGNQVELVAAIDIDEIARLAENPGSTPSTAPAALSLVNSDSALSGLQRELGDLRSMVEGQLSGVSERSPSEVSPREEQPVIPANQKSSELEARLLNLGLSSALADSVADQLPVTDSVEDAWALALDYLQDRLAVMPPDTMIDGGGRVALLGTTGVGKTTTLAKLAARFVLRHGKEQLALVSTDCYRVGGQEQLRAFADYLDVPLFVATDARELRMVLDQLQHKKMVLIDTPGFSQRDSLFSEQLELVGATGYPIDSYLILPATGAQRSLHEVVNALGAPALAGAVITKLDEAVELGGILDVAVQSQLPLAYVGMGQKVPEDLQPAQSQALIQKALALTTPEQRSRSLSQTLQSSLVAAMNRAMT